MRRSIPTILVPALVAPAASSAWMPVVEVHDALSDDPLVADRAITKLRAAGQSGVNALLVSAPNVPAVRRARFERTLDTVCAQRDCAASGLFWHTDLDQARSAAERTERPILSLRLLGRLDEDRSCANSRFFRTVLYADPQVAAFLRQRFVLHWSSERPVPALTIDFGDGRRLEGTITGNSVHYVLDRRGRVLDALPGLYGAGHFRARLEAAADLAQRLELTKDGDFAADRARFHARHAERLTRILARHMNDEAWFTRADAVQRRRLSSLLALASDRPVRGAGRGDARSARKAGREAATKSTFELPVLDAIAWTAPVDEVGLTLWRFLAEEDPEAWRLSKASRELLAAKHGLADDPWAIFTEPRTVEAFERSLAVDTVRNEYLLHREVHRWLAGETGPGPSFEELNARVYDELFLTPASDPWLGLRAPDTYLALDTPWRVEPATDAAAQEEAALRH